MKPHSVLLAILCTLCLLATSSSAQATKQPDRQVAVTIDDLPAGMSDRLPAADITAMTAKLLGTLRDQKIPAVGFVNERKLYKLGEVRDEVAGGVAVGTENVGLDVFAVLIHADDRSGRGESLSMNRALQAPTRCASSLRGLLPTTAWFL